MPGSSQLSQFGEFIGQVARATPRDLPIGVMQKWITDPESLREALRKALAVSLFPVWRVITIGTYNNAKALLAKVEHAGEVNLSASDLMTRRDFRLTMWPHEIKLVRTTVQDLGFPNGAKLEDVYRRARDLGLELLPEETGPILRLEYLDQPRGESLVVAMFPIMGHDGKRYLFSVLHTDGGLWLYTTMYTPESIVSPRYEFLFAGN
jgi:hypothetical protein